MFRYGAVARCASGKCIKAYEGREVAWEGERGMRGPASLFV